MKVLHVTTFPPRRCGIGDYAADLTLSLSRIPDLEIRILTYSDGFAPVIHRGNGIEVSRRLQGRFLKRRIIAELRAFEPDLVHMQSASHLHPVTVNEGVAEACEVPLVTTVHDAPVSWRVFYTIRGLRKIYNKSSSILVHSAGVTRTLSDFHHVGTHKIMEVVHGVDLDKYSPHAPREEALRTYALEGQRIVVFFGFLRPGKGLETLLAAWSKIESSFADVVLVVAGGVPSEVRRYDLLLRSEADYPEKVRGLATRLGISNRVVFTGYVHPSLVAGLLASSEVAVLPYDGGLPQSGPLHKALACGCAVVATEVAGFREVLEAGKDGLLVPPGEPERLGEAIKVLLDNPDRAQQLAKRAREKAEKQLGWSVAADRTLGIYRELVQR